MKTNSSERIAVLRNVALFADLSEGELAFLGEHSSFRRFAANELIFSEGDPCQGLFIVRSGAVKIFKVAPNGREQVLGVERSGNSVAELPVFDGGNYPASTIAVEESDLLFVRKEDFRALCLEHPEVALKVLRVVGRRLRGLVAIIEELSFTTVRQRLIAYLLRISGTAAGAKKSVELALPVSHQELAAELGTVRELVSRNLSRLQAEGLIKLQARSVQIPDLAALRAACEPTD
ncbi:MAG TPA: Crp/Fnr family transcriptional regulator [Candidatus Saccharimonadales bacterium]|nr:Crp/Fnr family transcriptional regulator [Candidatus Saccharimonadales bacterium]